MANEQVYQPIEVCFSIFEQYEPSYKRCPCGRSMGIEDKYCPSCGKQIAIPSRKVSSQTEKDSLKMQHDYIRGVVAKHNLAVETKNLPEDDPNVLFVKSTDFAKLQTIADEVKETLGDKVKFATYYPESGVMNELIVGFMIVDKTSV